MCVSTKNFGISGILISRKSKRFMEYLTSKNSTLRENVKNQEDLRRRDRRTRSSVAQIKLPKS